MGSTHSKYLIVKPEDSFAGASQNTSTTLSSLATLCEAFAELTPTGTTAVGFQDRVPGALFAHVLKLDSAETNTAQMQSIWHKFFCHALISSLPQQALPEAEERLVEIFEDYVAPQAPPQDLANTYDPRVIMAQQGQHYPRPEIDLED
jgi:hypothetical protein